MTLLASTKNELNSITEKDVLKSLEEAVEAYTSKDFQKIKKDSSQRKPTKKSKHSIEKLHTNLGNTSDLAHNPSEELPIESPIKVGTTAKKIPKSTKIAKSHKSKKQNILSERQPKKKKSKFFFNTRKTKEVISHEKANSSFFSVYRKQIVTGLLTFSMFSFAAMSGYIAYAFVSSGDNNIVQQVGNHVVLPLSETPKVYIIQSEKSEIFKNPLFRGIEIGDNVLSYPDSGKVIIYRSSEDKIVNIVNTSHFTSQ